MYSNILFKLVLMAYKSINGSAPSYLQNMFQFCHHGHSLKLIVPTTNSTAGQKAFSVIGPKLYNNLPNSVKMSYSVDMFKCSLKTFLFNLPHSDLAKLYSLCNIFLNA